MAKQTVVNISTTTVRASDSSFVELQSKKNLGPVPVIPPNTSLESNAVPVLATQTVATWNVMDKFDDGLKKALLDFIDTTKEGVKQPATNKGRTKIIDFVFYGTATKSVKPDEIGAFSLVLSYPPGATSSTSTTSNIVNSSTL